MAVRNPSILITDDDLRFREALQSVFDASGFRTLVAGDGQEALDIVYRDAVDLLLLDMHMPRLTGLETIRLVKRFRSVLPCILMSARADDALLAEARQADAFDVLTKPVSRQRVTAVARSALERAYPRADWLARG